MDLHKDFTNVRGVCLFEYAVSFDVGVNHLEDFVDVDFLEYVASFEVKVGVELPEDFVDGSRSSNTNCIISLIPTFPSNINQLHE